MLADWKRKLSIPLNIILLAGFIVGGCSPETAESERSGPLKVLVSSKWSFDYYKDYFDAAFPNIQFDLIEIQPDIKTHATDEQIKQIIEKEKPDLILFPGYGSYLTLANSGVLEELSPRLLDSGMKAEDFHPGIIERLRHTNDGQIYGMAPAFTPYVLSYNKDLFDKYGIEPPHDGMSMPEVFELASRFTKAGSYKDGIVGYHQPFNSKPHNILQSFSENEGMQSFNLTRGKVTVDTPAWKRIFQTVIEMYNNGTFLMQDVKGKVIDGNTYFGPDAMAEADLFRSGKAAMTLSNYGEFKDVKFQTGAVTPPVSSSDRNRALGVIINNIMGIRRGAAGADEAWKLIQYMNSDYIAKVRARLNDGDLPSRISFTKYNRDPLIRKLYELLPVKVPAEIPDMELYGKFAKLFDELVDKEIIAVVKKEKALDDAIKTIQKNGQDLLKAVIASK